MILQALVEYYNRLAGEGAGEIAPEGFQHKEIPFLIVLDHEGRFKGFVDTRTGEGKEKRARAFIVPRETGRSGKNAWKTANLLWDHIGYVLGHSDEDAERATKQHGSFRKAIEDAFSADRPAPVRAVLEFLDRKDLRELAADPLWKELNEKGGNLTFRILGEQGIVCEHPDVMKCLAARCKAKKDGMRQCLVMGELDVIQNLHGDIKGVWGAQTSGANIVSFNLPPFSSYGKEQGMNAPVGKSAEFAYVTVLNRLLAKDSRQRIQVGDASTVFWAEKRSAMENLFADFFSEPAKGESEQDNAAVRELFASPSTGRPSFNDDLTRFYVLGLSPNAARIAIRFWHAGTVREIAEAIRQHFLDCQIVHAPHEREHLSLFRLLIGTAHLGKADNIDPGLAGSLILSILKGTPYPRMLLGGALRRIRAEREITYPRASLIRAILVRQARYYDHQKKEVGMALDKTIDNAAYRLGRLFAVLEKVQENANPKLNATIRDRFYGAASSTPVTVFPLLLKLKNHHIAKMDNRGLGIFYEREIGEILDGIQGHFPAHLTLDDQGRFAIGYYHQRQDFYKKKEREENDIENREEARV